MTVPVSRCLELQPGGNTMFSNGIFMSLFGREPQFHDGFGIDGPAPNAHPITAAIGEFEKSAVLRRIHAGRLFVRVEQTAIARHLGGAGSCVLVLVTHAAWSSPKCLT